MAKNDIVVAVDIGTSKVITLIGEIQEDRRIEVIGYGESPSKGLLKGIVTDIEKTVEAVGDSYEQATQMCGVSPRDVFLAVSGPHVKGQKNHSSKAIKHGEVTQEDIDMILEDAQAIPIEPDRIRLHCLIQEYSIDKQEGIRVPLGMSGVRLEANAFIVHALKSATENFIKCCTKSGLEVIKPVLSPLASAYSVLTEDEKKLGVAVVDIGAGTSDILIYYKDMVVFTSVIGFGGDYITQDIASGLKTPTYEAESLKKRYGCAIPSSVDEDEMVDVPTLGETGIRPRSRQMLCNIIEARTEEILHFIHKELIRSDYMELLGAGVVLTGGVTSMPGVAELAEPIFEAPVRIGVPRFVEGYPELIKDPSMSTATGTLMLGAEHLHDKKKRRRGNKTWLSSFLDWLFGE